ncbi:Dwil\GK12675-PA-like protein [Anopheles sinensis]|uniref:Dwil\GK12675-PA-like protein n=1 Tax=Anopheles sinensis TaxID=74873 RepID=A0A084VJU6_ANOSI|nr:Dwil\GK12675-PA-like protein [Anopheles sinensis]
MIAHCVSSPDQTERRDPQYRRPAFADDIQNGSQIEPFSGYRTGTKQGHLSAGEQRAIVGASSIQPLIEQDVYDDDEEESEGDEGEGDDRRAVTVDDSGYEEGYDNGNVIIHDDPVRLPTHPSSARLRSTADPAGELKELNGLEAIENSFSSTSANQHHLHQRPRASQQQQQQQQHSSADDIVQPPSPLLILTTAADGANSLSTTDLAGLTVSTAVEVDAAPGAVSLNESLSNRRATRRPTNAQAAAMVQNMAYISTPVLTAAAIPHNEASKLPQNLPQVQHPTTGGPGSAVYSDMVSGTLAPFSTVAAQKHRTINSMNLNPTTPAMVVKPVGEHRKLLKSTGPILNYVFDHHPPYYKSNYYNARYGPHFETDNVTNITVQNGDTLFLSCRISLLQDKTVSWVRRKSGETALQLLTVGKQTYSGDSRYQIEFQYPNNWRLKISQANKNDEGVYECQISTHPPKVIIYYLHVNAPEVLIVDEEGGPLYDKYYEVGSTIKLMCKIRHISMLRSVVYWIHNENILNHDTTRGGISVKTNLTSVGANSTLFVAKVNRQDSGSYTCSIGPNQHYSISVHVLNGECVYSETPPKGDPGEAKVNLHLAPTTGGNANHSIDRNP